MAMIKAFIPGFILTFLVSGILFGAGARGGALALQQTQIGSHEIYWSWPIFVAASGLARALLWMMDS